MIDLFQEKSRGKKVLEIDSLCGRLPETYDVSTLKNMQPPFEAVLCTSANDYENAKQWADLLNIPVIEDVEYPLNPDVRLSYVNKQFYSPKRELSLHE